MMAGSSQPRGFLQSARTVSYTHLDVYKRQGKYRGSAVSIFMRHEDGSVPSLSLIHIFDKAAVLALLTQNAHSAAEQTKAIPEYPAAVKKPLQGEKACLLYTSS